MQTQRQTSSKISWSLFTLELDRDDAVFNGNNVDVSSIGDQIRPHVFENKVDVFSREVELVGGVEAR